MKMLTKKQLEGVLVYNPMTGLFVRKKTGKLTGTKSRAGYVIIGIGKPTYYAHRLAWLWTYGEWPDGLIDHIDRDKTNNRISNLRVTNKGVNAVNSVAVRSKSGFRGVYYQSNTSKWRVKAGRVNVGYFSSKKAAHRAYLATIKSNYGVETK